MEALKEKYAPQGIEIQTDFTSNNPVMEADLLITDWSDISWEYAFTTLRPVLYINTPMKVMNPEWQKIEYPPLNISLRDQLGKSLDIDQLDQAAETAKYLLENTQMYQEKINDLAHEYVYNLDGSAAVGARYMIKAVQNKLKKKGTN
jgi:YidC/Oxa1 family membrane protein insertase